MTSSRVSAAAVLAALALASCATPPSPSAPARQACVAAPGNGTVFGQELEQAARALAGSATTEQLVLAGLQGLRSIDPSVTITREGVKIVVQGHGNIDTTTARPGMNAREWRETIPNIVGGARQASTILRNEPHERLQEAMVRAMLEVYPHDTDCTRDNWAKYSSGWVPSGKPIQDFEACGVLTGTNPPLKQAVLRTAKFHSDKASPEAIVIAALKGLGDIDPELKITREPKAMVMSAFGKAPERVAVNSLWTAELWLGSMPDFLAAARRLSPRLEASTDAQLHQAMIAALGKAYAPPDCDKPLAPQLAKTLVNPPSQGQVTRLPVSEALAAVFWKTRLDHLAPVDIGKLLFDALGPLVQMDGNLSIAREGDSLVVAKAGRRLARTTVPQLTQQDGAKVLKQVLDQIMAAIGPASPSVAAAEATDATRTALIQQMANAGLAGLGTDTKMVPFPPSSTHKASAGMSLRVTPQGTEVTLVPTGTPAAAAGLRRGDLLLTIDGQTLAGQSSDQIAGMLRGAADSKMDLTYRRGSVEAAASLVRKVVEPVVVTVRDGIVVAELATVQTGVTAKLAGAIKTAKAQGGFRGVIIDLRGCLSGDLEEARQLADLFVRQGVLVAIRRQQKVDRYGAKPNDVGEGVPLVVLVDGVTTSVAETTASAILFHGAGALVGSSTEGLGRVHTMVALQGLGIFQLGIGRLESPGGWLHEEVGIAPHLCTAGSESDPAAVLAQIRDGRSVKGLLATYGTAQHRQQARTSCPPAARVGEGLEMTVAERLLGDRRLYEAALGRTVQ